MLMLMQILSFSEDIEKDERLGSPHNDDLGDDSEEEKEDAEESESCEDNLEDVLNFENGDEDDEDDGDAETAPNSDQEGELDESTSGLSSQMLEKLNNLLSD